MTNTEIGTGSAALLCTTTLLPCCFSAQGNGWFLPNGNEVMRPDSLPYYRTRAQTPGALLLHRNPVATTTGIFRCDIPDASNVVQSLYVGIYTSTTGESCTLSEWLVIYKERSSTSDKDNTFQVFLRGGGRRGRGKGGGRRGRGEWGLDSHITMRVFPFEHILLYFQRKPSGYNDK